MDQRKINIAASVALVAGLYYLWSRRKASQALPAPQPTAPPAMPAPPPQPEPPPVPIHSTPQATGSNRFRLSANQTSGARMFGEVASFNNAVTNAFNRTYMNLGGRVAAKWDGAVSINSTSGMTRTTTVSRVLVADTQNPEEARYIAGVIAQRLKGRLDMLRYGATATGPTEGSVTWTEVNVEQIV